MTIKNLKKSNGFATSDALIAILIITLFTGIIATIIYNIYISNTSIKRMGTATAYITNIFENMDKVYYEDINVTDLENYINDNPDFFDIGNNQINISSNDEIEHEKSIGNSNNPPYTININIQYYNKTQGNEDKLDLVKELIVTVEYKLGTKEQAISMTRVKSREKLVTPNSPDMSLLEIAKGKKVYHIKNINNKWEVCDERDSSWYSYPNGYWATVILSLEELQLNDQVDIDDFAAAGDMYVWIPRFAYNSSNNSILFLYSNTNSYVSSTEEYSNLSELEDTYEILTEFKTGNKENSGIWINNTSGEAYTILNSAFKRQV